MTQRHRAPMDAEWMGAPDNPEKLWTVLWGKSDYAKKDSRRWLPLLTHLHDSAAVAGFLWDTYFCPQVLRSFIEQCSGDAAQARRLYGFLVGVHDVGKAAPTFIKKSEWLLAQVRPLIAGDECWITSTTDQRHEVASHMALYRWLETEARFRGINTGPYGLNSWSWGVPVRAHHGVFPEPQDRPRGLEKSCRSEVDGVHHRVWRGVQHALITLLADHVGITDDDIDVMLKQPLNPSSQILVSGGVITADWIASNEDLHPYGELSGAFVTSTDTRTTDAMTALALPEPWEATDSLWRDFAETFRHRFAPDPEDTSYVPRPIQQSVHDHLSSYASPDGNVFLIVEDATGSGKTEAGLAAAEMLAHRSGARGVLMALPTRATSDAQFTRMTTWMGRLSQESGIPLTTKLIHGHSAFNDKADQLTRVGLFSGTDPKTLCCDQSDAVVTHDWMTGKHLALMNDFVVCTVDQILALSLRRPLAALANLATASKVVVIDEVHAADEYMRVFLVKTLRWLGRHGVPVVALSATLTPQVRAELHAAYLNVDLDSTDPETADTARRCVDAVLNTRSFPLVSSSSPHFGVAAVSTDVKNTEQRKTVTVKSLDARRVDDVASHVAAMASPGCIAVVCNTVGRAQQMYERLRVLLSEEWEILLLHSRYTIQERRSREQHLVDLLGPRVVDTRPERLIVIGTQVIEQSLDIDFDMMVSDIAPMSSLIQRMGRLHRHRRPQRSIHHRDPVLYLSAVSGGGPDTLPEFPAEGRKVYPRAHLVAAAATLLGSGRLSVTTPDDTASLVRDPSQVVVPSGWAALYDAAIEELKELMRTARVRARRWAVGDPSDRGLSDWSPLDARATDGDFAQVRDSLITPSVVVLRKNESGDLCVPEPDGGADTTVAYSPGASPSITRPRLSRDVMVRLALQSVSLPQGYRRMFGRLPTTEALVDLGYCVRWDISAPQLRITRDTRFLLVDSDGTARVGNEFRATYTSARGLELEKI